MYVSHKPTVIGYNRSSVRLANQSLMMPTKPTSITNGNNMVTNYCYNIYINTFYNCLFNTDFIVLMYSGWQWCGTATTKWDSFKKHFTTVRFWRKSMYYITWAHGQNLWISRYSDHCKMVFEAVPFSCRCPTSLSSTVYNENITIICICCESRKNLGIKTFIYSLKLMMTMWYLGGLCRLLWFD